MVPSELGTVGVGEATVDSFLPFMESIGINIIELLRETGSFFKQTILLKDWFQRGTHYWHPFYEKSLPLDILLDSINSPVDFYQLFLNVHLAQTYKSPFKENHRAGTGIHFDNFKLAAYLKKLALSQGVLLHDSEVKDFRLDGQGDVKSVELLNGMSLSGDYFLDCSGFNSILIAKTLKEPFHSFSDYLLNDRALAFAVPYQSNEKIEPWTTAQAMTSGWCWKIPLQHRKGMGYVHSSAHISPDEAEKEFRSFFGVNQEVQPRLINIRCGHHKRVFIGNALAIGLSSGFVEPLESTGIMLITRTLEAFREYLSGNMTQQQINTRVDSLYISTRDFLFLHYKFSNRDDSPYWRDVRNLKFPASLWSRMDVLNEIGKNPDTKDLAQRLTQALAPWDPKAFIFILKGLNYFPTKEGKHPFQAVLDKFVKELETEATSYFDNEAYLNRINSGELV